MGVEAAASRARRATDVVPEQLLFATTTPAYADKTNATAIHAALRLPIDRGRVRRRAVAVRSAVGALLPGLGGDRPYARRQRRRAHRPRRAAPKRRAVATPPPRSWWAATTTARCVAELIGGASGHRRVHRALARPWRAAHEGLGRAVQRDRATCRSAVAGVERRAGVAGLTANDVDARRRRRARASGLARSARGKLDGVQVVDDLSPDVGNAGAAQPGLLLVATARAGGAGPGRRAGRARRRRRRAPVPRHRRDRGASPGATVAAQLAAGAPGRLRQVPRVAGRAAGRAAPPPRATSACRPRRPPEARTGSSAFVGSKERDTGVVHVPPPRVSRDGAHTDEMDPAPLADHAGHHRHVHRSTAWCTRRARRSCSRSSTSTAAAGCPVELTDVDAGEVAIGHAGRDDVPPAVHRRRHRQLLLEGEVWCAMG